MPPPRRRRPWFAVVAAALRAAAAETARGPFDDFRRPFEEQCVRNALTNEECETRWHTWARFATKDRARKADHDAAATASPFEDLRLFAAAGAAEEAASLGALSYEPLRLGTEFDAGRCKSDTVVAVGVVTAAAHHDRRAAMRSTWLGAAGADCDFRFFVALQPGGVVPGGLLLEMHQERDVLALNFTESYKRTVHKALAIFKWGTSACNAWYVLRCNDDIYLRLGATLKMVYGAGPPTRVYAGKFLTGMRVPRFEALPQPPPGADAADWLQAAKAWTVGRAAYPADEYPTFAQGNAYIVSRDIAISMARAADGAFGDASQLPDDVLMGLVVDSVTAGNFRAVSIPTDYELEGRWTSCSDGALWHFNLHAEHMRDIHAPVSKRALQVELGAAGVVTVAVDAGADHDVAARCQVAAATFYENHGPLGGGGCDSGDAECVVAFLAKALAAQPVEVSQCAGVPGRVFCCG
ncbi:galactosyltransferase-domain-containing protein [Pelagophyceae sp. CCMP2097]|nr:galactosyltransferase-domain-containing protein [Pelagophyceae sp. CCMP2097]